MKISSSFLASLGVASLIPLLIFADVRSKRNTELVEKKAARQELIQNHRSDWRLDSEFSTADASRIVTWTETLNVPSGAIPIGPSHIPSDGLESIDEAVSKLLSDLHDGSLGDAAREDQVKFDACSPMDDFFGSFCVASAGVRNADWVLSLPIGQERSDELPEFKLPAKMAETLKSQTDVVFADFQLSRERDDNVEESIHFRLWYDYSTGKWQEIARRKHKRNPLGKYFAGI